MTLVKEADKFFYKADGFDEAVIGIAERCGDLEQVIAYDAEKCIDILMAQGMDEGDAIEFFNFNVAGAYVGPRTPVFIFKHSLEDIESYYECVISVSLAGARFKRCCVGQDGQRLVSPVVVPRSYTV